MMDNGRDTTGSPRDTAASADSTHMLTTFVCSLAALRISLSGTLTAAEAYHMSLCTRTGLKQQDVLEGTIVLGKDSIFLAPE